MKSFRLSEHFVLAEFERSATATAHGIDNTCPVQYVPVLQQLCKTILEPLRAYANSITPHKQGEKEGVSIIIGSGYRCNALNVKVGGVYASQHTLGEAADIIIPDNATGMKWFDWLITHTDFDQLILETANGKDFWIHVSCRRNKKANRHQVIRYLKKE